MSEKEQAKVLPIVEKFYEEMMLKLNSIMEFLESNEDALKIKESIINISKIQSISEESKKSQEERIFRLTYGLSSLLSSNKIFSGNFCVEGSKFVVDNFDEIIKEQTPELIIFQLVVYMGDVGNKSFQEILSHFFMGDLESFKSSIKVN